MMCGAYRTCRGVLQYAPTHVDGVNHAVAYYVSIHITCGAYRTGKGRMAIRPYGFRCVYMMYKFMESHTASRTSIFPVTAALMRAVWYSLSLSIAV